MVGDLQLVIDGSIFQIAGYTALADALGDRGAFGLLLAMGIIVEQRRP